MLGTSVCSHCAQRHVSDCLTSAFVVHIAQKTADSARELAYDEGAAVATRDSVAPAAR